MVLKIFGCEGLCLGFKVSETLPEKVDYLDYRFDVPSDLDIAFIKKVLFTKFKHWEYEQEYRVYVQLDEEENGMYFSEFSHEIQLKEVIVGDQSSVTRAEISDALGDLYRTVESFKARAGFQEFEIVRQQNSAKWV